jgi:hypothetical protein
MGRNKLVWFVAAMSVAVVATLAFASSLDNRVIIGGECAEIRAFLCY